MSSLRFPWGVEGYLTPREGEALYLLASGIPADRCVVELGAYKGRSTICLAQAGRLVVSIDHFEGQAFRPNKLVHPDHIAGTYREAFEKNVADWLGEPNRVHSVKGRTADLELAEDVVRSYGPVGLLFVDADHSTEAVRADYQTWGPLLAEDGLIAFHDANFPGPRALIEELLAGDGWKAAGLVDALRVVQRVPVKTAMEVA